MADSEWMKPREPMRQATEIELAQARAFGGQMGRRMRITRRTGSPRHPLDDPSDALITDTDVRINYEAVGDWLGMRPRSRTSESPAPVQRCAHCAEYPISGVEWRPWHPHFALLCSRCRSQIYLMAERCAMRQGRRLFDTLNEVVSVLHLGE